MITYGVPVTPTTPDSFAVLGQGYGGRVPVPVVIMLVLMVIFALIMRRTRFGHHVYATGGNAHAARLSGVKTQPVKLAVYVLSSTIASLAGIIGFSCYLSAEPVGMERRTEPRRGAGLAHGLASITKRIGVGFEGGING